MEKRTWRNSLQGVRFYVFILAIISVSSIVSVLHPQPAHAEGVLGRTLRCVVGGLLGAECPAPVTQTPAAPVAEPQPTAPTSNSNAATPAEPATVSQPTNTSTVSLEPMEITEPVVQAAELPVLPTATHRGGIQADFMNFAMANGKVYTPPAEVLGATALEPSSEGWRIFGVSWYWWGIGAIALVGSGLWVKKRYQPAS